jgi:hypothetical protein
VQVHEGALELRGIGGLFDSLRSSAVSPSTDRSRCSAAAWTSSSRHPGASSIICSGGRSTFQQSTVLTLDEADRMLDMGFLRALRRDVLTHILTQHGAGQALVFCRTKRGAHSTDVLATPREPHARRNKYRGRADTALTADGGSTSSDCQESDRRRRRLSDSGAAECATNHADGRGRVVHQSHWRLASLYSPQLRAEPRQR